MTNARYQRTRPMTNGRAPEQPHYAVITEDGWSSAPHPHPYPPSPVTGAHTAPPSREGDEPLAGPPITAGPRPRSQEPTRLPAAEEQSDALGWERAAPRASGPPAARTRSCAHKWPAHAPAACILARCSCSSCPGTTPTSREHGHMLSCRAWAYHVQPRSGYTPTSIKPCTHSHADPCTCDSCTRLQKPLRSVNTYAVNMPAHGWIWKYAHT